MSNVPFRRAIDEARRGWSEALSDIGAGLLMTVRASLMTSGALAIGAVGTLVSMPEARQELARILPSVLPINTAVAALTDRSDEAARAEEEEAVEEAEDEIVASDDPRQRAVTQYLSKRYRVADEAVGRVVAAAWHAGLASQVDPLLILAVMAIESSMNPFAESSVGAQGLMQVMTHVHADKFAEHGGDSAALDPIANIKVGSAILADLIRRGGSVERGLQLYVGAGNLVDDGGYGARVLAELGRLRQASKGQVTAALTAGMAGDLNRAATATPAPSAESGAARPDGAG